MSSFKKIKSPIKFLFILLLLFPLFGFSQDKLADHYKIFAGSRRKTVSPADIVADLKAADVLFFGEEHNDSTAHYLELQLLKSLYQQYPGKVALSMEMFETDCQLVLNEYLSGLIREKNFMEEARAWPNYKDYRPLIEFAKENHVPVIAANAPGRYVNMVNRLGLTSLMQLSATGRSYLPPLPIDTATGEYYQKFSDIMGGHASMPGMQLYQAQNLWDATMAWSIAQFLNVHPGYKVLQINGGFHSQEKLGAAAQLKKYAPKVRILNVAALSEDTFDDPDWTKFAKYGDYIILTDPKPAKAF